MTLQNFKIMLVISMGLCLFQFSFLFAQVSSMNIEAIPQKQLLNSKDVLITGWGGLNTGTAYNDMVTHLESLGYTVTGSNTFPADLTGYEILILVGGGSANEDIPEAAVDDFVNAGNGLIIMEGVTHFEDFDATANSNPIESTTGWEIRDGSTVTMPGNVLSQGLSATCSYYGYSSQITLKNGAVVPIEWNDGEPFAVNWTWGSGKVVYFNNAWIWYGEDYWRDDLVNGKKLMENALDYIYYGEVTGVDDKNHLNRRVVSNFILEQNYPNPFNPSTTIKFTLPKSEYVELKVYNILGKLEEVSATTSNNKIIINGANLKAGIYFVSIKTDKRSFTEKIIKK